MAGEQGTMTPADLVGKLVTLRDRRWKKPVQVRIVDFEVASGVCDHDPRCGSSGPHVWYWAKYA